MVLGLSVYLVNVELIDLGLCIEYSVATSYQLILALFEISHSVTEAPRVLSRQVSDLILVLSQELRDHVQLVVERHAVGWSLSLEQVRERLVVEVGLRSSRLVVNIGQELVVTLFERECIQALPLGQSLLLLLNLEMLSIRLPHDVEITIENASLHRSLLHYPFIRILNS